MFQVNLLLPFNFHFFPYFPNPVSYFSVSVQVRFSCLCLNFLFYVLTFQFLSLLSSFCPYFPEYVLNFLFFFLTFQFRSLLSFYSDPYLPFQVATFLFRLLPTYSVPYPPVQILNFLFRSLLSFLGSYIPKLLFCSGTTFPVQVLTFI